ncbi:unnamed protein product [Caretta caretta]
MAQRSGPAPAAPGGHCGARVLNHDVGMSEAGDASAAFSSPVSAGLKMDCRHFAAGTVSRQVAVQGLDLD